MGLVELPLYMPKQTEQFSNNQRLRPDLQAKAARGEAKYRLWDTTIGGALNLLAQLKKKGEEAKEQRKQDAIAKAKLTYDEKVHSLQRDLGAKPLNSSSAEVSGFSDEERLMPNFNYMSRELSTFGGELLGGIEDKDVRTAVELYVQQKNITAGDVMYEWDSSVAKKEAVGRLADNVQKYQNMGDVAGADGEIDRGLSSGLIPDAESAAKYKDSVRLGVSAQNLGVMARQMSPQEGLALLENSGNMRYQDSAGNLVDFPPELQKSMVTEYRQDMLDRDSTMETGYVDLYIGADTIQKCDEALVSVAQQEFFNPGTKKKIVDWFLGAKEKIINDAQDGSSGRSSAEDAWYKANEDRLAGQVALLIQKGNYRDAARLIQGVLVEKKAIRGEFAARQLALVQPGDDAAFGAIVSQVKKATEKLPPDQQGAIGAEVFSWYRSLPSQPTNEQIQRVIYDAQVASFRKAADNFYDYKEQSSELQKGAAEMSFAEQFEKLSGTASFARGYAERKYPKGEWGIDFSSRGAYAYADEANVFGLGRGHPVIRAGDGKTIYALVASKDGKDVTLMKRIIPGNGTPYWEEAKKLPPKEPNIPAPAPAGSKPVPAASAGDLTKIPKDKIDQYKDQDITEVWNEATQEIGGRDRMMLPTSKEARIAWLIKQGYLK